jgi:hypothetical protein
MDAFFRDLGKTISCVIKTVRHSGTDLPSLYYLTSKIYEGTELFILVEESLFLFIRIVLPLWLIYLALMVVLNQLVSIILNLLLHLPMFILTTTLMMEMAHIFLNICGVVCREIRSLLPSNGNPLPMFAQLYIYDAE